MAGSLKYDLDYLGQCLVHLTGSRAPWLMAGSLKFDLDRIGRWLVHLLQTTLVDG